MTLKEKLYKLIEEEPEIRTTTIIERMPYPCIDILEALDELKEDSKVESKPLQVIDQRWSNKTKRNLER